MGMWNGGGQVEGGGGVAQPWKSKCAAQRTKVWMVVVEDSCPCTTH